MEIRKKGEVTGEALKFACIICFKENGDDSKKDVQMFPFSKFRTSGCFCKKHADEILYNNKLSEYESMFGLQNWPPKCKIENYGI